MAAKHIAFALAVCASGPAATGSEMTARPNPQAGCAGTGVDMVDVAAVESRLEIRLADGRRLRLVGLDPALPTPTDPDLAETTRGSLEALLPDRKIAIRLLAAAPDRWGRLPALAFDTTGPEAGRAGGIAARAIGRGLARYLAEPVAHACRTDFLQAEQDARQAGLGLWHDPYYAVLRVDDQAAFSERSATTVVAEGELGEVQPGQFRTKLRFLARDQSLRGRTLVATILPRVMKTFQAHQIDVDKLTGRTLRFRGLLDLRFGPQVELTSPDALEILTPKPDSSASHG